MYGSPRHTRLTPLPQRAGFTLIELLIVIAVLALLTTIVISVVRGVVGNARAAATKATMRKLDGLLMKRVAAFERYCDGQDKLSASVMPSYARAQRNNYVNGAVTSAYQALGGTGNVPDAYWASNSVYRPLLLVLARKAYFRQMFPQSMAELRLDSSWRSNEEDLAKVNVGGPTEHAEVLYLSLTKLDSFGVEAGDLDEFKSNELKDTDSNGIPEFVDGWENPIRFYRWPTRLARPVLTAGNYGEAQYLIRDNMMDGHDLWHYAHTIPVGPNYDTSGATYTLLISAPPATTASITRGSGALLGDEHTDPLAKDPSDLRNRLHPGESTLTSVTFDQWNTFTQWMEKNLHTSDTYHIPLLVSAGQDKELGLLEPLDVDNFGHLAQPDVNSLGALFDNITNRNLQAGGR